MNGNLKLTCSVVGVFVKLGPTRCGKETEKGRIVGLSQGGPGEGRVKSICICFPFLAAILKRSLSNSTNKIWKNELGPKI
jgi:hypothetical protein